MRKIKYKIMIEWPNSVYFFFNIIMIGIKLKNHKIFGVVIEAHGDACMCTLIFFTHASSNLK